MMRTGGFHLDLLLRLRSGLLSWHTTADAQPILPWVILYSERLPAVLLWWLMASPGLYQARDCYGRHPVDYETACGLMDVQPGQ